MGKDRGKRESSITSMLQRVENSKAASLDVSFRFVVTYLAEESNEVIYLVDVYRCMYIYTYIVTKSIFRSN